MGQMIDSTHDPKVPKEKQKWIFHVHLLLFILIPNISCFHFSSVGVSSSMDDLVRYWAMLLSASTLTGWFLSRAYGLYISVWSTTATLRLRYYILHSSHRPAPRAPDKHKIHRSKGL